MVTNKAILNILKNGDRYGFQIVKELGHDTFASGEGILYPILHRMEDTGTIQGEWRLNDRGRRRRYYGLTKRGRKVLEKADKVVVVRSF